MTAVAVLRCSHGEYVEKLRSCAKPVVLGQSFPFLSCNFSCTVKVSPPPGNGFAVRMYSQWVFQNPISDSGMADSRGLKQVPPV